MPKIVFKRTKLDIKKDMLDRIIDAYLSGGSITRAHVSKSTGVSRTSSGKVASALVECGFMTERIYADSGERPSIHLFPIDGLNIMLIDLSTAIYSLSIVSTNGRCLFEQSYIYDTDASYSDNLNIFLSRCGYALHKSSKSYAATCVIYSDILQGSHALSLGAQAYLPTVRDKESTDKIIYSVFHRSPDTYIGTSEAIRAALRYGVIPHTDPKYGISYIFAGTYLYAVHVSNTDMHCCDISSLMLNGTTAGRMMLKRLSRESIELLLTQAVNLMRCAFGSSCVILDSDIYVLDQETASSVSREFAKAREMAPIIILSNISPSVKTLGAVKNTFALIVKRCIIPKST